MMLLVIFMICAVVGLEKESIYEELDISSTTSVYSQGDSMAHQGGFGGGGGTYSPYHYCWLSQNGKRECRCIDGYIGSPPTCYPGDELYRLCFLNNPCGLGSQCKVENGIHHCSCSEGFKGSPPNCYIESCEQSNSCGPNSWCDFYCYCLPGFVGQPPNCTAGSALLKCCKPYPCGGFSYCRMQGGAPVCSCLPGYVGTPPDCKPGREMWKICFKDNVCGHYSKCKVKDGAAVCSPCTEGTTGKPPYCFVM